jgi:uncharacterized protein (TIGR02270 family)
MWPILVCACKELPAGLAVALAHQREKTALLQPKRTNLFMPSIIPTIVTEHFVTAAFLWVLRENAVYSPHYSLKDLAKLDRRIEANLDGLRIAGASGWDICIGAVEGGDAGEFFVTAVLAFESKDHVRIHQLLQAGNEGVSLTRGVSSALDWMSEEDSQGARTELLAEQSSKLRGIGIAACTSRRQDPGPPLVHALNDDDPFLKATALNAVGRFSRNDLMPLLLSNLADEDEFCQFNAAFSAGLLGDTSAISVLKSFVRSDFAEAEDALLLALRRMTLADARQWQKALAGEVASRRWSVVGAGVIGDPVLVPWILDQMTVPAMARIAGESFTMITGVDIAYEDLDGEWPEGFEAGPNEKPEDEDVEMDPDQNLPWPDSRLISAWWDKNKGRFKAGIRYLCGEPITESQLQHVLRYGYQRQRYAAALELAIMHPGQPLFNVRAPAIRQKELLGLK